MRIKLDENLGQRGAALLREAGHEVATVAEEGLRSAADAQVIEVCRAEGRCLVTLDLEFANPLLFKPSAYSGIAVLRLPGRPTLEHFQRLVMTLLGGLAAEGIEGRLWIVEIGRIRKYQEQGQ